MTYQVSSSHTFSTTPERAYDTIVEAPLQDIFDHRSGPIPPVKEMRGSGPWGVVGAARTVVLADGSSNLETLVGATRPGDYRYELTDFTGPLKALASKVEGQFSFAATGDQTTVTWSWSIHPTNPLAGAGLPILGFFWKGWAAKMWPKYGARL